MNQNPGIVSIPLSFVTLVVVSLLTQKKAEHEAALFHEVLMDMGRGR